MSLLKCSENQLIIALAKFYRMREEVNEKNAECVHNYCQRILTVNNSQPFSKQIHIEDEIQIDRTMAFLKRRIERSESKTLENK